MRRHVIALLALAAAAALPAAAAARTPTTPIRHLVVLMQENHSFDNYFGTYPGADGLPAGTCQRKSFEDAALGCVGPTHVGGRAVGGLGSDRALFARQFRAGRMDGFVAAYRVGRGLGGLPNPLGYYDDRDLPFTWNLADRYVLFDRFFSSARGGSVWNHLFAISATPGNRSADELPAAGYPDTTTIFDRLEDAGIPWRFYVRDYDPTNTIANPVVGERATQLLQVPLLAMPRFVRSPQLMSHVVDMQAFYRDAQEGRLPAVSYIASGSLNEHPPAKLIGGQTFVRTVVNELMRSPQWSSTAFVLTYDSWGGWYDHVRPPTVDRYGYGFRVPALLVSPYAKRGVIDHGTLDFTSILRFVEDNWQLSPLAQRDARATSIASAFDFSAPPRAPEFIATSRAHPRAATVSTSAVYWAYGGAGLLAFVVTAAALATARPRVATALAAPARKAAKRPATRPAREPATKPETKVATKPVSMPAKKPASTPASKPAKKTPEVTAPRRDWDRQPREPARAWRAFEMYRDMEPHARSQRAVSETLKPKKPAAGATRPVMPASEVRHWSVRWHWIDRCKAYDAHRRLEGSR